MTHANHNQIFSNEQAAAYEQITLAAGSGDTAIFQPEPFDSSRHYEGIDMERNPVVAEITAGDNFFAVMKNPTEENPANALYLVTTRFNPYANREDGKHSFVVLRAHDLKPGQPFDFGRTALADAGDNPTNHMSRKQAIITVGEDGNLSISQVSDNVDTDITHAKISENQASEWEYDADDTIPREHLKPEIETALEKRENELLEGIRAIEARFDEETALNLWRFAANKMNKQQAQARGDGNGSVLYGQESGQAYQSLPEAGKEVADKYLHLMQQLEKVRSQH